MKKFVFLIGLTSAFFATASQAGCLKISDKKICCSANAAGISCDVYQCTSNNICTRTHSFGAEYPAHAA